MFVSTLKAILLGEKKLFDDLWIADSDYTWPIYGVIHLDFSSLKNTSATSLEVSLCQKLARIAKSYKLSITLDPSNPNEALSALTEELHGIFGKVAILIDEYDHPILSTLHKPQLQEILDTIQSFFATVKTLDSSIDFLFLTGVSAFAKAGAFSGLSHPKDLSDLPEYSCICGYTEKEIDTYFIPYIEKMAMAQNTSVIQLREELKKMYNGYHFAENSPAVYNPFSLTNALDSGKIKNYWFNSGTPSFLIEILKKEYAKNDLSIFQVEEFTISEMEDKYFDVDAIPIAAIMLQTGYLTIKDFLKGKYLLGFPNLEVQAALKRHIMGIILKINLNTISNFSSDLTEALTSD